MKFAMANDHNHDYWNSRNIVSYDTLHEFFTYDPNTGEIRNKSNRSNRSRAVELSGDFGDRGYQRVGINGKNFYGHRIAWCMMTGEWPDKFIDHIDGVKSNNKWSNLRLATKSQNGANIGKYSRNNGGTSKYKGVFRSKGKRLWVASITKNGKITRIGCFHTEEEAHAAYVQKAQEVHGEFARAG